MADNRKQKRIKEMAERKKQEVLGAPMQKDYLIATDENGELKYNTAFKIKRWKFTGADQMQDDMRQINAYIGNIRLYKAQGEDYAKQLKSGKITARHTRQGMEGTLMTKIDVEGALLANKINMYRNLAQARDHIIEQFMAKIDGEILTGELFHEFVVRCEKVLADLGFELFPEELEMIYPE